MPEAEYVRFKDGAGFMIRGRVPVEKPKSALHLRQSFYIISQLEASRWGTVQNYDKAGMSAGPLHVTAVLPAQGKQGMLWELLARMFDECMESSENVRALHDALALDGWQVTRTGSLVWWKDGKRVDMETIRTRLSAVNGLVPPEGWKHEAAKKWALLFHKAFADPCTYMTQELYTIDWLIRTQQEVELNAYTKYMAKKMSVRDATNYIQYASGIDMGEDLHLAMVVYHAFSVNGPAPALRALRAAMSEKTAEGFAKALIKNLGTTSYGRWRDTPDNKNRYDKTRNAVLASGYWNPERVNLLMPENLK